MNHSKNLALVLLRIFKIIYLKIINIRHTVLKFLQNFFIKSHFNSIKNIKKSYFFNKLPYSGSAGTNNNFFPVFKSKFSGIRR